MKFLSDLKYGPEPAQTFDLHVPENPNFRTIVYFHGGGLDSGDKFSPAYKEIGQAFASAGYGFASCNYAMYPQAKFPDFLRDAAKAVAYVKAHIGEYGGSGQIIVSGQSAGAWISLMLCLDGQYLQAEGLSPMEICNWLIDSAQTTSHFNVISKECGLHPLSQRIDEYAPLYYLSENTKFSKMLLLFYEKDMPCRPEQNMLFYKTVKFFNKDADVEYVQLAGYHCQGSSFKDADGQYPYVRECLRWLNKPDKTEK